MSERVHSLCPECSECPEVVLHDDGTVSIGEDAEWITLDPSHWHELIRLIRSGKLEEAVG